MHCSPDYALQSKTQPDIHTYHELHVHAAVCACVCVRVKSGKNPQT